MVVSARVAPATRARAVLLAGLVAGLGAAGGVRAQTVPAGLAGAAPTGAASAGARVPASQAPLVLEGPVDPDVYVVGPGDHFTITIGGGVPRQFTAIVSADGRLAIPEAGSTVAAGRSLTRVRAEALGALQRRYTNVSTDVTLSRPREFYVHVAGRVTSPGRLLVPAIARVDAAVEAAGGPLRELAMYRTAARDPLTRWPALRNVQVEHRDGGARSVDLMRYLATGDLGANPYLADGDRVYVPSFDPVAEGAIVGGAVDRPGTYDVRPGDTVRDLVEVASGQALAGRAVRVRRVRAGVPAADGDLAEIGGLDVAPRDQIYVASTSVDAAHAQVDGAVRFPGTYAITRGETTLEQLVQMAGGLRPEALARAAFLERAPAGARVGGGSQTEAADAVLPDVSLDADLLQGLFGRQFYARQTAAIPRVSMDPEAAIAGRQAVVLYEGDRLVVPFDFGVVRVYGRVQRSGFIPFAEGARARDYVAQAGGAAASADAVYVLDAATNQLVEGEDTPVRRGDAVFVNSLPSPDTPEFADLALQERRDAREDAAARRQARGQLIQTALALASTVATLILAYAAVRTDASN